MLINGESDDTDEGTVGGWSHGGFRWSWPSSDGHLRAPHSDPLSSVDSGGGIFTQLKPCVMNIAIVRFHTPSSHGHHGPLVNLELSAPRPQRSTVVSTCGCLFSNSLNLLTTAQILNWGWRIKFIFYLFSTVTMSPSKDELVPLGHQFFSGCWRERAPSLLSSSSGCHGYQILHLHPFEHLLVLIFDISCSFCDVVMSPDVPMWYPKDYAATLHHCHQVLHHCIYVLFLDFVHETAFSSSPLVLCFFICPLTLYRWSAV